MEPIRIICPSWLPLFWFGADLVTLRPFIFINARHWDTLTDDERDMQLQHEHIHIAQQRSFAYLPIFLVRYLWSPEYRFEMELAAYRINIRYYMIRGWNKSSIIKAYGDVLSGKTYWHMVSYASACYHVAEIISGYEKESSNAHI